MCVSRRLNLINIERYVRSGRKGNYALGYKEGDTFYVCYVGRPDLKARLKDHIDENPDYANFKFQYAATVEGAYKMECRNFHDFPNENNIAHPAKPKGYRGNCTICGD